MKLKWASVYAWAVATEIVSRLRPLCSRIEVAGSLRRGKREVSDVEIVYVPRCQARQVDLFSASVVSLADEEIDRMVAEGTLVPRLNVKGVATWGQKNKLAVHRGGVPVDLFATTEAAWWNYLVCRTGPASLNQRIATEALRRGYRWQPYGEGFMRESDGAIFPMQSEEEVFAFVGLAFALPGHR